MTYTIKNEPEYPIPVGNMEKGQTFIDLDGNPCMRLSSHDGYIMLGKGVIIQNVRDFGFPREFTLVEVNNSPTT